MAQDLDESAIIDAVIENIERVHFFLPFLVFIYTDHFRRQPSPQQYVSVRRVRLRAYPDRDRRPVRHL